MTVYRYPRRVIVADYLRAGFGLACTAVPLAAAAGQPIATVLFGGLTGLFAVFGARTAIRQATRIAVTEVGLERLAISTFGLGRVTVPWERIADVKVRYFSTRRDRERGWMQLAVRSGHGRITVDSTLEGFAEIAGHAARAAVANGVVLGGATLDNLAALGLSVDTAHGRAGAGRTRL
ncbi:MAG TPA: hypothetical protein VMV26_14020 [Alphaproteobacteria bacterium]|jgi:hypothetical protein|nr:hypothetical protein [Alphaproteobacteria bacterium]